MHPNDEQTIHAWAARQSTPVTITAARAEGDADRRLERFCAEIQTLIPDLRIATGDNDPFRAPALIIGRHRNIAYQAVPEGAELPPFLTGLEGADGGTGDLPPDLKDWRDRMALPVELTLFIAMQCPHCPREADRLVRLCAATPKIRLAVVDGHLFADQAAAHGIRAVPTLLLDGQMRWSGAIDLPDVIRQCLRRDPARLSVSGLRQLLEAGEAPRAAAMMIDHGSIFPSLLPLLTHERWSVRLGAMVVVEYLVEAMPSLAVSLIDPLRRQFDRLLPQVQGDVVQVLGQIDDSAARRCLQVIADGDFAADVKAAAAEELENRTS